MLFRTYGVNFRSSGPLDRTNQRRLNFWPLRSTLTSFTPPHTRQYVLPLLPEQPSHNNDLSLRLPPSQHPLLKLRRRHRKSCLPSHSTIRTSLLSPFLPRPQLPQPKYSKLNKTGHHRPRILPRLPSPPSLLHRKKPPLPRLAGRRSPRRGARATTCPTTTVRNESAAR